MKSSRVCVCWINKRRRIKENILSDTTAVEKPLKKSQFQRNQKFWVSSFAVELSKKKKIETTFSGEKTHRIWVTSNQFDFSHRIVTCCSLTGFTSSFDLYCDLLKAAKYRFCRCSASWNQDSNWIICKSWFFILRECESTFQAALCSHIILQCVVSRRFKEQRTDYCRVYNTQYLINFVLNGGEVMDTWIS